MVNERRGSGSSRKQAAFVWLSAATFLLLPAGCANFKSPSFLKSSSTSEAPGSALTQPQVELKVAFARSAEQRGDSKGALAMYNELIQTNQGTADVHHRVALVHDKMGESKLAETHYLESLKLKPAEPKVLCDYGYSLYLRESWAAAEAQFTQAIELDPQYMRSRVNLGMLMARTGRYDEALNQFAIGGLAEGAAHHNVALAAVESGDTQTATAALERSHRVDQGRSSSGDHRALGQFVDRIAARQSQNATSMR